MRSLELNSRKFTNSFSFEFIELKHEIETCEIPADHKKNGYKQMKLVSIFCLFIASLANAQSSPPVLTPQVIADRIILNVPAELKEQPPTMQRGTSPALGIFVSTDQLTDLTVNKSSLRWSAADAVLLSQFYKANILNLYDQVDMIQEGIREVDGRQVIYFEYTGQIVDEPNAFVEAKKRFDYTYIQYVIEDDGVLIFRLSAPGIRQRYWQNAAREIMENVQIKEPKRKR
jgi:hypothetical protein